MKKQKGFTLIELLVAIAIIAILSTVVMLGLTSARSKGRDAKRLSDIKQMQKALDLYYDTCSGYPALGVGVYVPVGTVGGLLTSTSDGVCPETFGSYMNPIPVNPTPGGNPYSYCSDDGVAEGAGNCLGVVIGGGNSSYQMTFTLENAASSLPSGDYVATPSGMKKVP